MEFISGDSELRHHKEKLQRLEAARRMIPIGSSQASQVAFEIVTVKTLIQAWEAKLKG